MIRFADIQILWGLLGIPVLILLFFFITRWKHKALARLGNAHTVKRLMPEVSFSRPIWKFVLFVLAYAFLIVAIADPQIGTKTEEGKRSGSDVLVLLDVSNSMLAADLSPNRLENAKRAISQMIDSMHNDRIGIVIFAGQAYVQLPITTDYAAAKLFLNNISTDIVPTQGTAIGAAIEMGLETFEQVTGKSKAMIIMTDGENHEDDAVAAAKTASAKGIEIHVIGEGSPEGAPVPVYKNGQPVGFHTDEQGKTVLSKLNEEMCKEIATAGNGAYVRSSNANSGLGLIMNEVAKMEKKTYESKVFKNYEDRFQIFLGITLALLLLEFFISNRKYISQERKSKLWELFEVRKS
ncbi:VWA domain-containing protein [Pedobacter sp. MC2016-14]|uniref:vWA domain-containing protein n=1 Tax=Pedobacter sp. MC2016-14 TaxID=2897327 RepID=UPI001E2D391D|nr:VWA domain-containing protein [Pedobacter sp. MC2016-14]MCD0489279.1 VWA domain-containing protein [Pedobacter sp. MC2016-14]